MNVEGFIDSLQTMGIGMAGIFVVMFIIYLALALFNKLFPDT